MTIEELKEKTNIETRYIIFEKITNFDGILSSEEVFENIIGVYKSLEYVEAYTKKFRNTDYKKIEYEL